MHRIQQVLQFPIREYVKTNFRDPLARVLPYVKPYWRIYVFLILLLFINLGIPFLMVWLLQHVTDAAIGKDFSSLRELFMLAPFILVIISAMSYLNCYIEAYAINTVRRDMKVDLFNKTLRLQTGQFSSYHSGELLSRLTNDINGAAGLIGSNLLNLVRLPIMTIAVFFYLISVNWKLSLISLSVAPVLLVSGLFFGMLLRRNSKQILENLSKVNSLLNDVFAGYTVVHTFSLERLMFGRYRKYCDDLLSMQLRDANLAGKMRAGASAAGLIAYLLNLGVGAYLVANGSLSVGSLIAFLSLMQYLVNPFTGVASCWSDFQRSVAALERVWEILGSTSESEEMPRPIRSSLSSMSVEFRDVSFGYDGKNRVLEGLNLSIPAGSVVAVVGASGAGKSTLFKLLLGLYPPSSGDIRLNHRTMQDISHEEKRSYIAYVPQDTYLFDGTIRENLLHGFPDATELELIKAAKDANIHDFIQSLPDKYDSQIGERGVRLSGGQKQRVSIARAILKNAPLLLLDEATSALDNESEYAVQESLGRLMKGRTTLVIAHRLSTIQDANWIIVMDKGRIVAHGSHEMLVKQNSIYAKMYHLQFRNREVMM